MSNISVVSSIVSTIHLQSYLQGKYAFENAIKLRLLKAGINHSYQLIDGERNFIFRIYTHNWRSQEEILAELTLLEKLKENKLPVSYPLKNKEGDYLIELSAPEGLRYGVLFSFAKGKKQMISEPKVHEKVGRLMAQFHQITEGHQLERIDYNAKNILHDSLVKLHPFLSKDSEQMQWMLRTQRHLSALWKGIDSDQVRQGVVHLDIWFDNLNVSDQGEVTLFDFDFCGNGWQCLDLAYYQLQLFHLEKEESIRTAKLTAFFAGYESVQAISAEERKSIPMLGVALYYFYLGVQCDRFEDWSNVFLNEAYLKRFIDVMVKEYYSNHF